MHRVLPPANVLPNLAKSVQAASRQPRSLKVKRSMFFQDQPPPEPPLGLSASLSEAAAAPLKAISIFIR